MLQPKVGFDVAYFRGDQAHGPFLRVSTLVGAAIHSGAGGGVGGYLRTFKVTSSDAIKHAHDDRVSWAAGPAIGFLCVGKGTGIKPGMRYDLVSFGVGLGTSLPPGIPFDLSMTVQAEIKSRIIELSADRQLAFDRALAAQPS